jgi:hypothetical protein
MKRLKIIAVATASLILGFSLTVGQRGRATKCSANVRC